MDESSSQETPETGISVEEDNLMIAGQKREVKDLLLGELGVCIAWRRGYSTVFHLLMWMLKLMNQERG